MILIPYRSSFTSDTTWRALFPGVLRGDILLLPLPMLLADTFSPCCWLVFRWTEGDQHKTPRQPSCQPPMVRQQHWSSSLQIRKQAICVRRAAPRWPPALSLSLSLPLSLSVGRETNLWSIADVERSLRLPSCEIRSYFSSSYSSFIFFSLPWYRTRK